MVTDSLDADAAATLRRINRTWLEGRIDALEPLVHPEIVMVIPGFAGAIQGRAAFLAGFQDFCVSARVHQFDEHDLRVDRAGKTAVVSFRFTMIYERGGECYRSTGRDLWVFEQQDKSWIAVWRTMLDLEEQPA